MVTQVDAMRTLIARQHHGLRTAMLRVLGARGPARQDAFDRFRQLLAAHESAEQEFVHSRTAGLLEDDWGVAVARAREEDDIAELVGRLEQLPVTSNQFDELVARLHRRLLAHLEAEEHHELPVALSHPDGARIRDAVAALEQVPDLADEPIGVHGYQDWLERAAACLTARVGPSPIA